MASIQRKPRPVPTRVQAKQHRIKRQERQHAAVRQRTEAELVGAQRVLVDQQQQEIQDGWNDEYRAMAKRADEAKRHDGEDADIKRIDRSDVIAEQLECEIVIIDHPGFVESETERLAAIGNREIGRGAQSRIGLARMGIEDSHQSAVRVDAVTEFVERVLDFDQADHSGRAVRRFGDCDRQRRGVPIIVGHDRIEPLAHAVRRDQQDEQQADGRQKVEHAVGAGSAFDRGFCARIHGRQSAVRVVSCDSRRGVTPGGPGPKAALLGGLPCQSVEIAHDFPAGQIDEFERGRSARRAPRHSCSVQSA